MRDMLREFPIIIELLSMFTYCIVMWGWIWHIKVSKKLKKQEATGVAIKETLDEFKVANRLILIGSFIVIVIRLIGVLIHME